MPIKKRKPRILMLYDFPIKGGGSGSYVKYLSLRLQETYRYDVAIAAPESKEIDPKLKIYNLNLPQVPVYIGRPGLEKAKKYSDLSLSEITELYNAYLKETVRVVEKFKPDIIHVHHVMINLWVASFIRSVYGIKFIVTSHGSCLHAISQDRRYFRKTREALKAADMITVVSGDTRSKLLKMFGADLASKTRTIPGGVRMSLFPVKKQQKDLESLRKSLGLDSQPIVLFTGRLISEKGVEYLIKAASKINASIVIAGDGPQRRKLKKLVEVRNLKNVHLLGHFDYTTLINLYYLSDVFISPAVWDEPLGLTIIEAMAAGKPVVATRKGGVTMAVKDKFNGLFVRPRNASDIAEKVNRLLADPSLRKKMGERARDVVQQRFTWTSISKKFSGIYSKI